ncbi:hypothetical protein HBI81_010850 [Parastagonospora nodorum]|nr:hypothetical protein HBI03_058250 [Parastagonospora nodorum]KAH4279074.1 hypothetical protein HBI04_073700 [Parastagonospora nodorum]KAH4605312.1 hypothetical protein HBH82_121100 [Parastagonospora nodorum]KAH4710405.1 hypothetical protein HBH67_041350 [Parastagonospora nodorum]KAH4734765.1 hypothetical protein HBH78_003150 [Parastagonospora nodorum]
MLTYPDRATFEQIRAQWEAAQHGEEETVDMVGRKVSQQQPTGGNAAPHGTSKFRRTLSHGLAFISNPLSQRKITPGQHLASKPTLAVTASGANGSSPHFDAPISRPRDLAASKRPVVEALKPDTLTQPEDTTKNDQVNATSSALPRSRTTSFLPRPVGPASGGSYDDQDRTIKLQPVTVVADPKLRAIPSKIPSPSPPLSERRVSSPRQYLPQHMSRHDPQVVNRRTPVADSAGSPSKLAVRSRTTPNLVKAAHSPQPAHNAPSSKAGYKKPAGTPVTSKSTLQENVPTKHRISQRRSQIIEKDLKRESLAAPATVKNRKSIVQDSPLGPSKQPNESTPTMAKKRMSSNLAEHTPVTAKRVQPRGHQPSLTKGSPAAQPRVGPRKHTPAPLLPETPRPELPRLKSDKEQQRKTLNTPNGLGGIWRSSRALAAANHEVRLPRSFTFHNYGTSTESLPPVPAIPDQYGTPSLSSFFQPTPSFQTYRYKMDSMAASCESIPEETKHTLSTVPDYAAQADPTSPILSNSSDSIVAQPSWPYKTSLLQSAASTQPSTESLTGVQYTQNDRPWSISDRQYEDSANIESYLQVRDYMPPLYWAGRFQSRCDHWRTEAMTAELDPTHTLEGQLGQCRLSQDKLAACYIFAQMRDLCLTEQAANSLWEFEYKYRKDNRMLSAEYPMHPARKHDNPPTDNKGSFGRAMRKLTPRKSSFVNLLKGKGWGTGDDQAAEMSPGSS